MKKRIGEYEAGRRFELTRLMHKAIGHYGAKAQLEKTIEELDELREVVERQAAHVMEREEHLIEEVADVYNMLDQVCILYDIADDVRDMALAKMERTGRRIDREAENGGNQAAGD